MHLRSAFFAAVVVVVVANTLAADTVRANGGRGETRRLDLRPADSDEVKTERTCWLGWGYGYGYYGGYSYSYFAPYYSFSYPYFAPYYSFYYRPFFAWYSVPVYVGAPVISYYGPIVAHGVLVPYSANGNGSRRFDRADDAKSDENRSFRYDGDRSEPAPAERIPRARDLDAPAAPESRPAPDALKLGPSPVDRPVGLPSARPTKKYAYPAYGEHRDAPKPPRDSKTLLIRDNR